MKIKLKILIPILGLIILICGVFIGANLPEKEPTISGKHLLILEQHFAKMEYENLNSIRIIDKSVDNDNWVCYYCYADGDCFALTIHNGIVERCMQMN